MNSTDSGKRSIWLTLGAIGVVYGDLGTSPLYTLRECLNQAGGVTDADVLGVLSLVFWSLMFIVIIKYIVFIMRADNEGEGGVMSLLALALRSKNGKRAGALIVFGLAGTALLLADGIITPAVSVLGAIEGVEGIAPWSAQIIVPAALAILLVLFLPQRRGSGKISKLFGPLMLLWFGAIAVLGFIAITGAPRVLLAVDPSWAVRYFAVRGPGGLLILGAVILAVTGTEALYADMGHFGKRPIRIAWFAVVMPALLLNYFGQGAAVLTHGAAALVNPFFFLAGGWFLVPMVLIATVASMIASQALISGAFSIVREAIQLGFLPKFRVVHTSLDMKGQIYIPLVNWLLMIGCMALVVGFKSSGGLAAAYGIAVVGTMLCTSFLFRNVMIGIWKWRPLPSNLLFLAFVSVDVVFLLSNLPKIESGGWFPIATAIVLFMVMRTWKAGSKFIKKFLAPMDMPIGQFIENSASPGSGLSRVPGTAIFLAGAQSSAIGLLLHHFKHEKSVQATTIMLSFTFEGVPYVGEAVRYSLTQLKWGFWDMNARYGYSEQPDIMKVVERLNEEGFGLDAYQISYYMGRVTLTATGRSKMPKWEKHLFRFMHRNAASPVEYFNLPPGCVVEIGRRIEL